MPWLQGAYFFADYARRNVWTLRRAHGVVSEIIDRTLELKPAGLPTSAMWVTTFGEDAAGELYFAIRIPTALYTVPGIAIYRIDAGPQPCADPIPECAAATNSTGHAAGMDVALQYKGSFDALAADYRDEGRKNRELTYSKTR